MKKFHFSITLIALCASCASNGNSEQPKIIGMPNPWHDCATLDEAINLSGIPMTLPTDMQDASSYRTLGKKMIEIIYPDKTRLRKSHSDKENHDNSGNYNKLYTTVTSISDDLTATIRGNNDEKAYVIFWNMDEYDFSISTEQPTDTQKLKDMAIALIATEK